ncbi:MAG: GNAT family N-acetyltransferase, partial [Deltaproteobacteria bacterium]|nr:GNAT family N-acetyltransferase [Deltaproteobacteria bacterium]
VAVEDGSDVGGGHALVGWHSEPGVGTAEAWTVPAARGRGVGQELYERMLAWAVARGCLAVDTNVVEDDPASLAWAERRGFRRIGSTSFRVLDLAGAAPDVRRPEGIEIATWAERPGIERDLYAVFCEASPDVPGHGHAAVPPFERWLAHDMKGASDRSDAVFVAFAGGEVVGYAKLAFGDPTGEIAWHDLVGVKRAWRGRGIAGALKRTQIVWAKQQGFRQLKTRNEERNLPIARLNEQLGYVLEPGTIQLRTMLSSPD